MRPVRWLIVAMQILEQQFRAGAQSVELNAESDNARNAKDWVKQQGHGLWQDTKYQVSLWADLQNMRQRNVQTGYKVGPGL